MREIDSSNNIRRKLAEAHTSPFRTYMDLTVGQSGLMSFFHYELLTCLFGLLPGGLGILLRRIFYSSLFNKVGQGVIVGRNVVIRHPNKIIIGDNVTIDDNCLIDARGVGSEGLIIEDNTVINRNCLIQAKSGPIRIGKQVSIGSNSVIVSMDGIDIAEAVLMAGGCYVSAGSYHFDDLDIAVMDQGVYSKGPIRIEKNSWIGTGVIVLDGVLIGEGAIVGAGSLVNKAVPAYSVVVGVPARVVKMRAKKQASKSSIK